MSKQATLPFFKKTSKDQEKDHVQIVYADDPDLTVDLKSGSNIIGRASLPPDTDKRVSRTQLDLQWNERLHLVHKGKHPIHVFRQNGDQLVVLEGGGECDVSIGDRFGLLLDQYQFHIRGKTSPTERLFIPFYLTISYLAGPTKKPKKEETKKREKEETKKQEKEETKKQERLKEEEKEEKEERGEEERGEGKIESNDKLIEILTDMGNIEKASGEKYRSVAYFKAVRSIKNSNLIIRSGNDAKQLEGIGKKIALKIDEIIQTGQLQKLNKNLNDPRIAALRQFNRIHGIGAKMAEKLVDHHKLYTLDDLKKHKILLNPQQIIGLEFVDEFEEKIPRKEIEEIEEELKEAAAEVDEDLMLTICGSYRRGAVTSGDIDCLVTKRGWMEDTKRPASIDLLMNKLKKKLITHELASGDKKFMGVCRLSDTEERKHRRLDLRFIPHTNYACAIVYFTGSDRFNVDLRNCAISKAMTLNEYHLKRGGQIVPVDTEEDLFEALNKKDNLYDIKVPFHFQLKGSSAQVINFSNALSDSLAIDCGTAAEIYNTRRYTHIDEQEATRYTEKESEVTSEEQGRSHIEPYIKCHRISTSSKLRQDSTTVDKAFNTLFYLVKKGDIRTQFDARRFVLSALGSQSTEKVVSLLGDEDRNGIHQLGTITTFEVSPTAGNKPNVLSFQRVVLPLFALIVDPAFTDSPYVTHLRRIYSLFYSQRGFLDETMKSMQHLCHHQMWSMRDEEYRRDPRDHDVWSPSHWSQGLRLIVRLFLSFFSLFDDAPSDHQVHLWVASLDEMFQNCVEGDPDYRSHLSRVKQTSDDINRLKSMMITPRERELSLMRARERGSRGPGDLCGSFRFDNDCIDFRDISILPTEEEMLYEGEIYLPREGEPDYLPPGVDRYLDSQFRLLREDSLSSVRRAVKWMMREGGEKREEITTGDGTHLNVYRNVKLDRLDLDPRRGAILVVRFDQPRRTQRMSVEEKRDHWMKGGGAGQLQVGSLVVLMMVSGKSEKRLYAAQVVERYVEKMEGTSKSVEMGIEIPDRRQFVEISTLYMALPNDTEGESLMIQIKGHFFTSTRHVMKALQKHRETTLPFSDDLIHGVPSLDSPYYSLHSTYDLTCLAKKGSSDRVKSALSSITMGDYDRLKEKLKGVRDDILLDTTQSISLACALTRKISLIQGPPGTGKTYIGVHLVRTLIQNLSRSEDKRRETEYPAILRATDDSNERSLPILCICYTNHALDQFMEGLLEGGVPLHQVVRIGGRSKSSRLLGRNLKELKRGEEEWKRELMEEGTRSGVEHARMKEIERKLGELGRRIESSLRVQRITEEDFVMEDLLDYLDQMFPHQLDQLLREKSEGDVLRYWLESGETIHERVEDVSVEELTRTHQVWSMNAWERKRLFRFWVDDLRDLSERELNQVLGEYEEYREEYNAIDIAAELRVLRANFIIGMTTSGGASHGALLSSLRPQIILCEEAGEVLESHLLASLTSGTQHLILIGDHLQLRPKVEEYRLSVEGNGGYKLDVSLFERLFVSCRERHGEEGMMEDGRMSLLTTQRRMRSEIAQLMRVTLYPQLEDGDNVKGYPHVRGMSHDVWFYNHNWREDEGGDKSSHSNTMEAEELLSTLQGLLDRGYRPHQLAILTPYTGQVLKLREMMKKRRMNGHIDERSFGDLDLNEEQGERQRQRKSDVGAETERGRDSIRLSTVKNFQGEESDIILLSTVRCNERGRTAKIGLYIFGSVDTIRRDKEARVFHRILTELEDRRLIGDCLNKPK
ncbi:hypothetical protein PROFUN_11389 [Planoprotostelium fungivorum]|uniref:DNA polymerase beta n=1 Tax=Planoprotostelium fungivorum TaxID=1890364 RepID=A0A2P6N309_9EUKA|nr:hypothetical protein PROFUN_11389 [Planoprotostelium fungivorum]